MKGNATNSYEDFFKLEWESVHPKWFPNRSTKNGIIVMIFSHLAGILDVVIIAVYGLLNIRPFPCVFRS